MMPRLAVDFRSEENRVRLYYAAAVSLFGALASRLVATGLLPWNAGGEGLFWCGAVALVPLVLYGWRALPAASGCGRLIAMAAAAPEWAAGREECWPGTVFKARFYLLPSCPIR